MRKNKKTKNPQLMKIGLILVCAVAIISSAICIASLTKMQNTAAAIYDHPYTVSNEARAMRSRLLDLQTFISTLLTESNQDDGYIYSTLHERYAMQDESISIIKKQYLGPTEDTDLLQLSMQALKDAQAKAVDYSNTHTPEEIESYIKSHLYPQYDLVNNTLLTVIDFANSKVQGLEAVSSRTAFAAATSSVVLTAFLIICLIVFLKREQNNTQALRYREHLFNILAENVDDAFLIYHVQQNNCEFASENFQRITEVPYKELEKNPALFQAKVLPEDQDIYRNLMQPRTITQKENIQLRIRNTHGRIRWIRFQIYPEMLKGHTVRYIISVSDQTEDMTVRQTLKEALLNAQEANNAKQTFLSRMSHEIRTPMNAIIGMTTIAGAYINDQHRVKDCLTKIGYSSKHLLTLINDVLDMSKIDEGKLNIGHELFHLETVVESITSIIYPQAEAKELDFSMHLTDVSDTDLYGDPLRINQILLNLLSNALKFTPKGGSVHLDIRELQQKDQRARFRFTVADTGIGMKTEFLNRLFLPFEQESIMTGQKYGGTGLGMSITKNLITLMGGTISVQSECQKGTRFTVELDFDIASSPQISATPAKPLDSLYVLIADDDEDSCIHTSLLLKDLGIEPDWVLTGQECIHKIQQAHRIGNCYDVCLIDWKIPDIDGIEITRRVREFAGPDTLIIIITAYDWSGIEQRARDAGADGFLSKPLFASTLYNTLLSVTGRQIPVVPAETQEAYKEQLSGRHILLAEDNALNQEIGVELLKMAGVTVTCACNGQEALDLFLANGEQYDAILMDIQMPVMDGYQATRNIRSSRTARARTIPIIAMTADAFHEDIVKAAEAGMDGHIAKPIEADLLFRTLLKEICSPKATSFS